MAERAPVFGVRDRSGRLSGSSRFGFTGTFESIGGTFPLLVFDFSLSVVSSNQGQKKLAWNPRSYVVADRPSSILDADIARAEDLIDLPDGFEHDWHR